MADLKTYLDASPGFVVPSNLGGHVANIALVDGFYVMSGISGTHRLAADCTDAARLEAHWVGFVESAGELSFKRRMAELEKNK